jgi:hypothetical protein
MLQVIALMTCASTADAIAFAYVPLVRIERILTRWMTALLPAAAYCIERVVNVPKTIYNPPGVTAEGVVRVASRWTWTESAS